MRCSRPCASRAGPPWAALPMNRRRRRRELPFRRACSSPSCFAPMPTQTRSRCGPASASSRRRAPRRAERWARPKERSGSTRRDWSEARRTRGSTKAPPLGARAARPIPRRALEAPREGRASTARPRSCRGSPRPASSIPPIEGLRSTPPRSSPARRLGRSRGSSVGRKRRRSKGPPPLDGGPFPSTASRSSAPRRLRRPGGCSHPHPRPSTRPGSRPSR